MPPKFQGPGALASIHWTGLPFLKFVSAKILAPRIKQCAIDIHREALRQVDAPKHGIERRTKENTVYTSSAEGEPLASPTGVARKSIEWETGMEGKNPAARVGTNHKPTVRHIIGANINEGPRDMLVPAINNRRQACIRILQGKGA